MLARLLMEIHLGQGGGHRLSAGQSCPNKSVTCRRAPAICISLGFLMAILEEVTGVLWHLSA